jgi:hypothetical protein
MNIKELHEALSAYHKEQGRPKFADAYLYACFLDYLDDYNTEGEAYKINEGVTIETVWSKYLEADSPVFTILYGYEDAEEASRQWFTEEFCTETQEEEEE